MKQTHQHIDQLAERFYREEEKLQNPFEHLGRGWHGGYTHRSKTITAIPVESEPDVPRRESLF